VHITRADVIEVDPDTGAARFVMDGVALMEAEIDVAMLQKAIRGQPVDEALAFLRQALPTEAEPALEIEPSWMVRVPWFPFRIAVIRQERGDQVVPA
jgi:hypothetical protein